MTDIDWAALRRIGAGVTQRTARCADVRRRFDSRSDAFLTAATEMLVLKELAPVLSALPALLTMVRELAGALEEIDDEHGMARRALATIPAALREGGNDR